MWSDAVISHTLRLVPKCPNHSTQFGTSAEVSCGHFGTGNELSRPHLQQTYFGTIGHTEKGLIVFVIIFNEDDKNTPPRTSQYTNIP